MAFFKFNQKLDTNSFLSESLVMKQTLFYLGLHSNQLHKALSFYSFNVLQCNFLFYTFVKFSFSHSQIVFICMKINLFFVIKKKT